jgi:hypothetical protein
MLSNNPGGEPTNILAQFEAFDGLPREVKQLIWDGEIDACAIDQRMTINDVGLDLYLKRYPLMERVIRSHFAYAHYGPDHPSATKEPNEFILEHFGWTDLGKRAVPWREAA